MCAGVFHRLFLQLIIAAADVCSIAPVGCAADAGQISLVSKRSGLDLILLWLMTVVVVAVVTVVGVVVAIVVVVVAVVVAVGCCCCWELVSSARLPLVVDWAPCCEPLVLSLVSGGWSRAGF